MDIDDPQENGNPDFKISTMEVKSHKKGRPRFEDHTVLHSGNKRLGKHSGLRLLHKELKAHNVHVYLTKDDVDAVKAMPDEVGVSVHVEIKEDSSIAGSPNKYLSEFITKFLSIGFNAVCDLFAVMYANTSAELLSVLISLQPTLPMYYVNEVITIVRNTNNELSVLTFFAFIQLSLNYYYFLLNFYVL